MYGYYNHYRRYEMRKQIGYKTTQEDHGIFYKIFTIFKNNQCDCVKENDHKYESEKKDVVIEYYGA
jgi:hypothetical protein